MGWFLLLKEHTNAIGDRSRAFFSTIRRFPGVVLINENVDSYPIIESAKLVITNTGTIGLEAALMGVPTITLSRVVFNCLNYCRYMSWNEFEKYDSLVQIIDEIKTKDMNNDEYRKMVEKYSFKGIMSDTVSRPGILEDKKNLGELSQAFLMLVSRHE